MRRRKTKVKQKKFKFGDVSVDLMPYDDYRAYGYIRFETIGGQYLGSLDEKDRKKLYDLRVAIDSLIGR